MPIYEYRCLDCSKKNTIIVLSLKSDFQARCKFCGSTHLKKLVSRVTLKLSEERRLEKLADPSFFSDMDERDPRSLAKWMKRFGKELGEDLEPDFEDAIEESLEEEMKEREERSEKE